MRSGWLLSVAWLSASGLAWAQDGAPPSGESYRGVIPGAANPPPVVRARGAAGTVVTWPGFEIGTRGSRVFIQTTAPLSAVPSAGARQFVLRLPNSVISTRNNRNPLVTTHFNTPITSARLRRAGRDVELVIDLRADVTPTVTSAPGQPGFQFIFVEFPAGNYLPDGPPPVSDPRASLQSSQPNLPVAPARTDPGPVLGPSP